MKRFLPTIAAIALALTAGCWREIGAHYLDPDFPNQRIATIAILPILNKTEQPLASEAVLASLARHLSREKKFAVIPTAKVMSRLRSGGGGAAYVQLTNQLGMGKEPSDELYELIARGLDADALFQESVLAYHHLREDVIAPSMSGAASYQQVPVTVVSVQGLLWSTHARAIVWRDDATQRYYHDPATEGEGSAAPAVDAATHAMLAHLPENTWAPVEPPRPTPVPSPVTSLVPFNTPADPNAP